MKKLPKFKERVINFKNKWGQEVSYSIASSFKGILRLSPNNFKNTIDETYYQDGTNSILESDNTLQVSDSDGNMLDLRIGKTTVEANNLYVKGIVKTSYNIEVSIQSPKDNVYKNFILNENILPVQCVKDINIFSYDSTSEDENHVGIYSTGTEIINDKVFRSFSYKNLNELIDEIVSDVLLSNCDVPTGSIVQLPINIEQYNSLKGLHNSYYYGDNEKSDPIIRDYLLCDGGKYFSQDFPELAKIVYKTRQIYGEGGVIKNDKENDLNDGTFRVPDLRHKFIKSIDNAPKGETGNNIVGKFQHENINSNKKTTKKDGTVVYDNDSHHHFITYGSYSGNPLEGGALPQTIKPGFSERGTISFANINYPTIVDDKNINGEGTIWDNATKIPNNELQNKQVSIIPLGMHNLVSKIFQSPSNNEYDRLAETSKKKNDWLSSLLALGIMSSGLIGAVNPFVWGALGLVAIGGALGLLKKWSNTYLSSEDPQFFAAGSYFTYPNQFTENTKDTYIQNMVGKTSQNILSFNFSNDDIPATYSANGKLERDGHVSTDSNMFNKDVAPEFFGVVSLIKI